MNHHIGVIAHHQRRHLAEQLAENVRADHISIDDGTIGANTNHHTVWRHLAQQDTQWSIALEDDAQPIDEFRHHLTNALAAAPTPIVSLYLGRQRPPQYQQDIADALDKADANHAHWIIANQLLHHVGVAIHTDLLPDMLHTMRAYYPVDENIGQWARRNGHPIGYTVPSLVDHRDTPTLITHPDGADRTPGRIAWRTGTHDTWNSDWVEL